MENKQNVVVVFALIIIVAIAGFFWYLNRGNNKAVEISNVTFPAGNETLVTGKTYTLKWITPTAQVGATTTSVFLIDTSLLSQGASVSIIDRVFNIPDSGTYEYTIPTGASDGSYFFVIGTSTSNWFKISSVSQE